MKNNTILVYSDAKNNNELKFMSPDVSLRAYQKLDNNKHKDNYVMVFSLLGAKVNSLTKLSSFKILTELQSLLSRLPKERYAVKPNTIHISQKSLAERLQMHRVTIAAGLEELEKAKIIFQSKNFTITLNPLYFWKGDLVTHQMEIERYYQEGLLDKAEVTLALQEAYTQYETYFI